MKIQKIPKRILIILFPSSKGHILVSGDGVEAALFKAAPSSAGSYRKAIKKSLILEISMKSVPFIKKNMILKIFFRAQNASVLLS